MLEQQATYQNLEKRLLCNLIRLIDHNSRLLTCLVKNIWDHTCKQDEST